MGIGERRSSVCVDYGAAGVRAVQLRAGGDRWVVDSFARAEFSEPCVAGRRITPRAPELRRCLRQAPFRGKAVVVALSTPEAEFHALELPPTVASGDPQEAARLVQFEIGRLAIKSDEPNESRHWLLPPCNGAGANTMGVAASRPLVLSWVAACDALDRQCAAVDTFAAALCCAVSVLRGEPAEGLWGVLDLGARESRLLVCLEDVPILVRNVGGGGLDWTAQIADALRISGASAEVHKRDFGVAPKPSAAGGGGAGANEGELARTILSVLRADLNRLAGEVKRSFTYASSCYPGRRIEGVILVGGSAVMHNLSGFLGGTLGIDVRTISEFARDAKGSSAVEMPGSVGLEQFAIAIGLALRSVRAGAVPAGRQVVRPSEAVAGAR